MAFDLDDEELRATREMFGLKEIEDTKDIDSAILIVEKFILGNYILRGGRKNIVKDSLRYILSDYKRVLERNEVLLKENEKKDELIEKMKKYLLKENKMCDFLESEE